MVFWRLLNETESYLEDGIPSDQYNYDTEIGKDIKIPQYYGL